MIASVFWSFLDSWEDIIMGSHKEGGATTFWSYILNLPLSSNSMISWKFCYLLHKLLRDGHRNVRCHPASDSPRSFSTRVPFIFLPCLYLLYRLLQILTDTVVTWKTWASSGWVADTVTVDRSPNWFLLQLSDLIPFIVKSFQGNLHDRYGHIVALSAKFLCLKMEFHKKVKPFFYFLDCLYKHMWQSQNNETIICLYKTTAQSDTRQPGGQWWDSGEGSRNGHDQSVSLLHFTHSCC